VVIWPDMQMKVNVSSRKHEMNFGRNLGSRLLDVSSRTVRRVEEWLPQVVAKFSNRTEETWIVQKLYYDR